MHPLVANLARFKSPGRTAGSVRARQNGWHSNRQLVSKVQLFFVRVPVGTDGL